MFGNSNDRSEKLNRIDVDRPSDPPCGWTALECGADVAEHVMESAALAALQQELGTVAPGPALHWCADRTEDPDIRQVHALCDLPGGLEERVSILSADCGCPQQSEP